MRAAAPLQDNITYTVINVLSITATAVIAAYLFNDRLTFDFLMACAFVSLSCYLMYAKKLDQVSLPPSSCASPYVRLRPMAKMESGVSHVVPTM
jgi:hypothetical protein